MPLIIMAKLSDIFGKRPRCFGSSLLGLCFVQTSNCLAKFQSKVESKKFLVCINFCRILTIAHIISLRSNFDLSKVNTPPNWIHTMLHVMCYWISNTYVFYIGHCA